MCLFTTRDTISVRERGVVDPPPHRSRYSAHPPPGTVRIPRNSSYSYRRSHEYVDGDRVIEHRRSRPAEIEYVERSPRASRRSVDYREVDMRGSRGSFVDERRRSVSRVRY
ncbi:hypothetical protein EJ04DRAFT_444380 [Polyplosphaeria fusca]|uniref:Uncharacterized protein n=1 Tax=Polyplosphaeria fusca TaxID=682080 RepID=A0A9P4QNL7_9PLEO|nr:hypothetical protein EJ04DRAFT_444380 [Polyplosphaeria fusca]